MKYAFITGIPASGKSYLASKVAAETGVQHIEIDKFREEMSANPQLKPWVDFFWKLDEEKYFRTTTPEDQWKNLVKQSEAFWPTISQKIKQIQQSGDGAIFEGVNLLPHLIKNLNIPGIVLLGESFEQIFDRNKKEPRWGKTEKLQKIEAEAFWNHERPRYEQEAKKFGFRAFADLKSAEQELLKILK